MKKLSLSVSRRRVLSTAALSWAGAITASRASSNRDQRALSSDIAEMLMLGFSGATVDSTAAQILASHIEAGRVAGVFFVRKNIGSREDVSALVRLFSARSPFPILTVIDHEGGAVQRLTESHGFTRLPSARVISAVLSRGAARDLYAKAAAELSGMGFNVNLAPVVDLHDPANPVIGGYDRAFDSEPAKVTDYARAFIDGMATAGIICALKHFPGHGRCSHRSLPDITATWSERELEPYQALIGERRARMIMSAHLRLATIETEDIPATLSAAVITGLLRGRLGFGGVVITDDLDMAPVSTAINRREAIIRAIAAGNDIVMIKNVDNFDPELPQAIAKWVSEAIEQRILHEQTIVAAAARVRALKRELSDSRMRL